VKDENDLAKDYLELLHGGPVFEKILEEFNVIHGVTSSKCLGQKN
jgi:hypothetical protein